MEIGKTRGCFFLSCVVGFFAAPAAAEDIDIRAALEQIFAADIRRLEEHFICKRCGCKLQIVDGSAAVAPNAKSFPFRGTIAVEGKNAIETLRLRAAVAGVITIAPETAAGKCSLKFTKDPLLDTNGSSGAAICRMLASTGARSEFARDKSTDLKDEHCEKVKKLFGGR